MYNVHACVYVFLTEEVHVCSTFCALLSSLLWRTHALIVKPEDNFCLQFGSG
jgi:hypothetical protein